MDDATYDVVVIGGGSTGENVAARSVQGGLSATLVEADLVGGECSYWACMPSKALLRPPETLDEAQRVDGTSQAVTGDLDQRAVLARRDGFASNWDDEGQARWLASAAVDLVRGRARLDGPRQVQVTGAGGDTSTLTARQAVAVCTGSAPALAPVPGLPEAQPWTNHEATSTGHVPTSLAIIGGGVAGCEMADVYHALGSDVVVLERGTRLLPGYEPLVGDQLAGHFRQRGIDVRTGTSATRVSRSSNDGPVTLTLDDGTTITADQVLAATGRRPRTDDLGLETIGLSPGDWLDVDDTCQVAGVEGGWLYAVGDVNARSLLTHMGKYQARACADTIAVRAAGQRIDPGPWSRYTATADHTGAPQVVFTNPQVAAVGRTESEARQAGLPVHPVEYDLGAIAGSVLYVNGYQGRAKIVIDTDRQVIVGATLIGPAAGELLHAATVAVTGEVPLDRLWHAVPSFPTISEVWLRLLETYGM